VPQTIIVGARCGTVNEQDPRPTRTEAARRLDVFLSGQGQGLAVDDPRDLYPVHHRDHQRDDPQAGLEDRRQRDRQEQRREGHHQVGETHDRGPYPTLRIAGDDAQHRAEQHRHAVGHDADNQ